MLSLDEKTQIQALDRTQPLLPIEFDRAEQRTHDYVRHGTTNLFAALNVSTGEVIGDCAPSRNGAAFLAFCKKAAAPHAGREIHVVSDNLSTHTTPAARAWLDAATVHLDRYHRRNPGRSPAHPAQHQETRREQLEVNRSGSRCARTQRR